MSASDAVSSARAADDGALTAELVRVCAAGRETQVAVFRARQPRIATLMFVHGAGCDRHTAEPLARALADFDVIAPDLPGRGGTPGAPCTTATDAAAFVGAVLDALSVPRAVVLGHSYGGAIALELASTRALDGLVLVSTGARLRVSPGLLDALQAHVALSPESAALSGWTRHADSALVGYLDTHARAVPSRTTLADWRAADAFDRLGVLDALQVRTLVIGAADDVLTPPKYAAYLAAHLAGARLEVLPDAGHMLPLEQPARLAPLLRAFVTDTP